MQRFPTFGPSAKEFAVFEWRFSGNADVLCVNAGDVLTLLDEYSLNFSWRARVLRKVTLDADLWGKAQLCGVQAVCVAIVEPSWRVMLMGNGKLTVTEVISDMMGDFSEEQFLKALEEFTCRERM